MDISRLKLIQLIQNYEFPTIEQLQQQINRDKFNNPYVSIINLLYDSNISTKKYSKFKKYIIDISNQYFSIDNQYTTIEKKMLIFFSILKAQHTNFHNSVGVIIDYENLPPFNTSTKPFIQWVEFSIKNNILTYYLNMNDSNKIKQIINEIDAYSNDIKKYSP